MYEPKFDKRGYYKLIDYSGNSCCLTRKTWEMKIAYPEREFLKLNFGKIELTITDPEEVRRSTKNPNCKVLYKKFSQISIREGVTVPGCYFAVVIDERTCLIKTIYPTPKIKKGERLWPK